MLNIKVRIKSVDMYGHLGRTNHPTPDMVGLTATVLGMTTVDFEGETLDAERILRSSADDSMTCYDCITQDGRLVELMDFEVEPWSLSTEPVFNALAADHAVAYQEGQTAPLVVPKLSVARVIPIAIPGYDNGLRWPDY